MLEFFDVISSLSILCVKVGFKLQDKFRSGQIKGVKWAEIYSVQVFFLF